MEENICSSIEKLHLFWTSFVQCEDEGMKIKWLELFLFEYTHIIKTSDFNSNKHRFLSSVASQLTCYTLQLIYAIICQSVSSNASDITGELDLNDGSFDANNLCSDITIAIQSENNVIGATKPSDITAIVSLREFLIHGIGGRILELLLKIDTKNMLCARELTSLLVNLFPTYPWDIGNSETAPKEDVEDFITLANVIELMEHLKIASRLSNDKSKSNEVSPQKIQYKSLWEDNIQQFSSNINHQPEQYESIDSIQFRKQRLSCDYIGSLILNLCSKLVSEEIDFNMDKSSVTIQCLNFSVDIYCEIAQSTAFAISNREKLQRKLLTIMYICLRNILGCCKKFDGLIDITSIFKKLLNMLTVQSKQNLYVISDEVLRTKFDHLSGLVYCLFIILHKIFLQKRDPTNVYHKLFELLKPNTNCIITIIQMLLTYSAEKDSINILPKLIHILCKLIHEVRNYDDDFVQIKSYTRGNKRKNIENMCTHHHKNTHEFGCLLEKILLNIAQYVEANNLAIIFKFIKRKPICCCNNNMQLIELLLINSRRNKMQKSGLNFIKNNFLNTIYSNIDCTVCDGHKAILDVEDTFFRLYKNWLDKIDAYEMIVFLKHVNKISKLLPFDISFKFFVDIVLPPFRREKKRLIIDHNISNATDAETSKEIIICCLNIFLCYLKDIRLMKGFFNEENLQHMDDLIVVPEFASLVCCLLKIGIDNASFLGENCGEQLVLSEKLRILQVNSISNVTDILVHLFEDIECFGNLQLQRMVRENIDRDQIHNRMYNLLQTKKLSIQHILHLGVVYWNLILQLFRTNAQFKASFQQTFLNEENIVFNLVYNSFSCFLTSTQHTVPTVQIEPDSIATSLISQEFCWISKDDLPANIEQWLQTDNFLNNKSNCDNSSILPPREFLSTICLKESNLNICDQSGYRPNGIFNICEDIDIKTIVLENYNSHINDRSSISETRKNSNHKYIYSLRNTRSENNLRLERISQYIVNNSSSETKSELHMFTDSVQKIQQFLSNSVFDIFFNSSTDCDSNQSELVTEENKCQLFAKDELNAIHTTEYKKLFLQLFEITCGVMMSDNNREINDLKMRSTLRDLKTLLLKHSLNICDSTENGTAIISALQSLLKIAEMRYKCCITEDCSHSAYSQRNKFALNTSIDGEKQCCAKNFANDEFSSEIEQSEEESTSEDNYLTADEGYDGDAEIAGNLIDTELEDSDLIKSNQIPVSRYRSHIVHEGICRIVIDILIDLSKRGIENPNFWPKYLMQIATRVAAIRESIGGSLHLIKGFSPILECNDMRLRDFQKSILELITDVNTPDTYSAYLKILTSDDPPIDLLLPRLVYLGSFSYRVQPSVEIEFPTKNDESIKSSCDLLLLKDIKQIHDYHEYHNLKTAFTQATYIIPLNYINFKVWNQTGCTITTWIKIKPAVCGQDHSPELITNSSERNEQTIRKKCSRQCSFEEMQTHLLSIGSNKLLLSIHMNSQDTNTLYFQLSKPSAQINEKKAPKLIRSNTDTFTVTKPRRNKSPCSCSFRRKRKTNKTTVPIHKEINIKNDDISNEHFDNKLNDNVTGLNVLTSTRQAIKSTRLAIRNSFSQFNLFSQTSIGSEFNSFRYPLEVRGLKLPKNKWIHLGFSIITSGKEISIRITIDGLEQHDIHLPMSQISKNEKFQLLCIGDKLSSKKSNDAGDGQSLDHGLSYSLANVNVFRKCLSASEILANIVALGPDCTNFTQCQIGNTIPNLGFLNPNKYTIENEFSTTNTVKLLQENIVAVYSAHNPTIILGYNSYESTEIGEPMGLITFGNGATTKYVSSFQSAVLLSGGLSSLLYLFARVIELSNSEIVQSSALSFLLRTAHSHSHLYTEFVKKDYTSLIGPIIRSTKCIKGIYLLNSILETACDIPVLTKRGDTFHVIISTSACILYPDLLISVLNRYSDWHKNKPNDAEVIEILLATIQALVREKHPKQSLNIMRLTKAGFVSALLHFCKIYLVGVPQPVYLSHLAAESFVNLISTFAGAPPPSSLLDDITKVLLLLHRPSDSFITHDRSKFYFLLSSMVMVKQKRLSLPLPTRKLSINIKRERKKSIPIRNNGSKRSISLDSSPKDNDNNVLISSEGQGSVGTDSPTLVENKENNGSIQSNERIFQFEQTKTQDNKLEIESIVDCSRLDRKTLNLYNPIESAKFDKALINMHIKKQANSKKRIVKRYRQKTRGRSRTTTESETDRDMQQKGGVSESGLEEDMSLMHEYVIIAAEDIKKIEESFRLRNSITKKEQLFEKNSDGVIRIQNGFFNLLRDFILILPDNSIQEVLTHYVTVDVILIMANHHDPSVRTSIIRLLGVICDRLGSTVCSQYTKSFYWHHLGNQIALHPADMNLIQVCVQWITGSCLSLEQIINENELKVLEKQGLNPLIALIPQTVHDLNMTRTTIQVIDKIYMSVPELLQYLVDNGLLTSMAKLLSKFFLKCGSTNDRALEVIHNFLCKIALKALTGTITILWDLLNALSFVEENKSASIFRGIRSTQATIMNHLLQSFFPKNKGPSWNNFKLNMTTMNIVGCTLSNTEKKTRFDLLIDRIVQFITNVEPSHTQSEQEIQLIENIINLSVMGYQRGSNVVPWGLCPSRPMSLKLYIINTLWKHSKHGNLPSLGCDGKIVKTMAQSFFLTDREIIPLPDLDILTKVCNALGVLQTSNWNLSQTLEKFEMMRENSLKEQKPAIERTVFKFESIVQPCIELAMKITRNVVELQNMERRILMNEMRAYDESGLSQEWKLIIDRMTHEGAPWHCEKNYPNSWELDQTEGPSRCRVRFKRCKLNIESKFFQKEQQEAQDTKYDPLSYLQSSLVQRPHYSLSDQVLYTFACKHLPIDNEIDGEMIITESHLIFLANDLTKQPINIEITSITDIWLRRYQHLETGLEFFLETNNSKFFIFQNNNDRNILVKFFADKIVQCPDASKLAILTQQWKEGQLTNWEYLTTINQISGRTYQDLMQYPIFPWVLSDYHSVTLNLNDPNCFRNLERPIAIQHKESEVHYINNYNYLTQALAGSSNTQIAPYHYGSHYSNSGTVLHFLVRIPPFTQFFLRYQDDSFDLPDRTFHSLKTTWRLASKDSPTDVKELIPEFFCLPEMFENSEGYNFGERQSGETVNHVALPSWANNSNRLFVLIHRQTLECDIVRKNLHKWIDLVFGYKQTGQAAVDAINVFHPATYIGFSTTDIVDPVEKIALDTMIRTYGQMPRQLMKKPHPMSNLTKGNTNNSQIVSFVKGLQWGIFTGSPQLAEPYVCNFYQQFDMHFASLVLLGNTNVLYGVPKRCNVMQGSEPDTMSLISWDDIDGIVRIKPFCDENVPAQPLVQNIRIDEISSCGTDAQLNQLWFGHKSGRISVYQCTNSSQIKFNKNRYFQHSSYNKMSYNSAFRNVSSKDADKDSTDINCIKWKHPIILIKHTNEVTAIHISKEYKIVVSVARDGFAILWDLNNIQYIRCIERPSICNAPISLVTISPTLGDIVTVHSIDKQQSNNDKDEYSSECLEATENIDDFVNVPIDLNGKSLMRLHTINGKYVNHITMAEQVRAICYSYIKEGTGINVVATGIDDGIIRLWSSWDLTLVKEIHVGKVEVMGLMYSTYQHLVVLTSDNIIQVWESAGLQGNPPKFPQIVFHKRSSV